MYPYILYMYGYCIISQVGRGVHYYVLWILIRPREELMQVSRAIGVLGVHQICEFCRSGWELRSLGPGHAGSGALTEARELTNSFFF